MLFNFAVKTACSFFFDYQAAVIAHNAFCLSLRTVFELFCKVWLADKRSAHRNEICLFVFKNIFHIAELMYAAHGYYGDGNTAFYDFGVVDIKIFNRRRLFEADLQG